MNTNNTKQQTIDAEILNEMRECSLLKLMNDEQFDKIVKTCKVVELPAHSVLFEQDSKLTHIYLVIKGDMKLLRLVPSGDEKVMDIVRPGKTFAEGALFSGNSSYPVTSTSIAPTVVVGILGKTYLSILEGSNDLCFNMLGYLSMRLKWMVTEVERLTLHNARFRLIEYMLNEVNEEKGLRTCITLGVPKHVLASRLSIKPETLSRTFKELADHNLIKHDGSQIELLDVGKLRNYISLET